MIWIFIRDWPLAGRLRTAAARRTIARVVGIAGGRLFGRNSLRHLLDYEMDCLLRHRGDRPDVDYAPEQSARQGPMIFALNSKHTQSVTTSKNGWTGSMSSAISMIWHADWYIFNNNTWGKALCKRLAVRAIWIGFDAAHNVCDFHDTLIGQHQPTWLIRMTVLRLASFLCICTPNATLFVCNAGCHVRNIYIYLCVIVTLQSQYHRRWCFRRHCIHQSTQRWASI